MCHSLNQAFRIIGFLGHSAWCWEQHEGRRIWTYYVSTIIRCPGFIIITPSILPFGGVFGNQRFSNCRCSVGIEFVSSCWTVFVVTACHTNIEFCCHLCCSSSVIFRYNPLQCTAIPFTLFWLSATISLSWCCLRMICVCHHTLGNCCSGYS